MPGGFGWLNVIPETYYMVIYYILLFWIVLFHWMMIGKCLHMLKCLTFASQ